MAGRCASANWLRILVLLQRIATIKHLRLLLLDRRIKNQAYLLLLRQAVQVPVLGECKPKKHFLFGEDVASYWKFKARSNEAIILHRS